MMTGYRAGTPKICDGSYKRRTMFGEQRVEREPLAGLFGDRRLQSIPHWDDLECLGRSVMGAAHLRKEDLVLAGQRSGPPSCLWCDAPGAAQPMTRMTVGNRRAMEMAWASSMMPTSP